MRVEVVNSAPEPSVYPRLICYKGNMNLIVYLANKSQGFVVDSGGSAYKKGLVLNFASAEKESEWNNFQGKITLSND